MVDHECPQALGRRVHGRGETRRSRTHDHDVELARIVDLGADLVAVLRQLIVGGIVENRVVGEDDRRSVGHLKAARLQKIASFLGVVRVEGVRNAGPSQEVADLVPAARPGLGDDGELETTLGRTPPLLEELRDQSMKELVGRSSTA